MKFFDELVEARLQAMRMERGMTASRKNRK